MFYQISLYQYYQALINKLFLKSPYASFLCYIFFIEEENGKMKFRNVDQIHAPDKSPIGTHDSNETSIFMQEFGRVPSFPTRSSVVFRRGPERWFCWRMERV